MRHLAALLMTRRTLVSLRTAFANSIVRSAFIVLSARSRKESPSTFPCRRRRLGTSRVGHFARARPEHSSSRARSDR